MGRKLDAWIGEYIMFLHGIHPHKGYYYKELQGADNTFLSPWPIPGYTSDLNEAIKVIHVLSDQGHEIGIVADKGEWFILQVHHRGAGDVEVEYTDVESSLPMAICLAAYKLKTGKDWEG